MNLYAMSHLYIHWDTLMMLTASTELIGQSAVLVLNMYNLCALDSWNYYHYICLLLM